MSAALFPSGAAFFSTLTRSVNDAQSLRAVLSSIRSGMGCVHWNRWLTSKCAHWRQAWIAARHLVRANRPPPPRMRVAALRDVPVGSAMVFTYPGPQDRCLLIRPDDATLVAFSQSCTHLSCAVVPRIAEGVLHCPCHEGYFDLRTGRNIAGPPPRPLPRILLETEDDDVYAVGMETGPA